MNASIIVLAIIIVLPSVVTITGAFFGKNRPKSFDIDTATSKLKIGIHVKFYNNK